MMMNSQIEIAACITILGFQDVLKRGSKVTKQVCSLNLPKQFDDELDANCCKSKGLP